MLGNKRDFRKRVAAVFEVGQGKSPARVIHKIFEIRAESFRCLCNVRGLIAILLAIRPRLGSREILNSPPLSRHPIGSLTWPPLARRLLVSGWLVRIIGNG